MEKRKLASEKKSRRSIQKENVPLMVVSPIQRKEDVPPSRPPLVLRQCSELLALQESIILSGIQHQREQAQRHETSRAECEDVYSQLDEERLRHAETLQALEAEREKVQMALTEVDVLRKQLEREKATFEKAFGLAKSQALSDSSKAEHILIKCTALETLCAKKDEELASKSKQVETLQRRIRQMKAAHKREMEELQLKVQQELYVAQTMTKSRLHIPAAASRKSTKRKQ